MKSSNHPHTWKELQSVFHSDPNRYRGDDWKAPNEDWKAGIAGKIDFPYYIWRKRFDRWEIRDQSDGLVWGNIESPQRAMDLADERYAKDN